MKWWHKIKKPVPAPEVDHEALKRAHQEVAREAQATADRWEDVRSIASALRERSNQNHLAEAILQDRRRRRGHA